eukprot:29684-Pelagococcus_subviridis.AAC.2
MCISVAWTSHEFSFNPSLQTEETRRGRGGVAGGVTASFDSPARSSPPSSRRATFASLDVDVVAVAVAETFSFSPRESGFRGELLALSSPARTASSPRRVRSPTSSSSSAPRSDSARRFVELTFSRVGASWTRNTAEAAPSPAVGRSVVSTSASTTSTASA